jgi:hypothetical protein
MALRLTRLQVFIAVASFRANDLLMLPVCNPLFSTRVQRPGTVADQLLATASWLVDNKRILSVHFQREKG